MIYRLKALKSYLLEQFVDFFNNWQKESVRTFLIAAFYFVFGYIGFQFAVPPGNISAVWAPAGISVGLMLVLNWRKTFLGILLGSFFVNLLGFRLNFADYDIFRAMLTSFTIALGSILQAGIISFLIRKYINISFNYLFDVFKFVLIVISSCLSASTVGVSSLWVSGFLPVDLFLYVWTTWLLGDVAGVLLITPLFITWKYNNFKKWNLEKFLEGLLLFLSVFLISQIIFNLRYQFAYPLIFGILPLFVWAALRFTQFEVCLAFFISACVAIISTSQNNGLFVSSDTNASFLFLQFFIAITGLTKLTISTALYELKRTKLEVEEAYKGVELQIVERTKKLEEVNNKLLDKIKEQEDDRIKLEKYHTENQRLIQLTKALNKA